MCRLRTVGGVLASSVFLLFIFFRIYRSVFDILWCTAGGLCVNDAGLMDSVDVVHLLTQRQTASKKSVP